MTQAPVAILVATLVAAGLPVCARPDPPEVDQGRVDAAIRRGAAFLQREVTGFGAQFDESELVVYTLLHAGVPIDDPVLAEGLKWVKSLDVRRLSFRNKTYRVAVAAMALEAVSAEAHRLKLAQFAHFLVCNQCENGQWDYGENVVLPDGLAVVESGPAGPAGPGKGQRTQPLIPIRCPRRIGPPEGDFSNTQFALLGLRACARGGCDIPIETWKRADRILEQGQRPDGGWSYKAQTKPRLTAPEGQGNGPAGKGGPNADVSYGSMTCSGVCGLVITKHYLGEDHRKDRRIRKGLDWLAENFSVESNPRAETRGNGGGGRGVSWHTYYLYALERAGLLCETERFGSRWWYSEGATLLLDQQYPNGGWESERGKYVSDTCFAILFLRRATKPIETVRTTR